MKKTFLVFVVGLGLIACGDNNNSNGMGGGTIDSNVTAPTDNTMDNNSTIAPDTSAMGTSGGSASGITDSMGMQSGGRSGGSGAAAGAGNGSGQGSSTNSNNSGSATDDTKGSK